MANPTLELLLNSNNPLTVITGANLNNLSSGSAVLGSSFSNIQGDGQGGGYPVAVVQFHCPSMVVSSDGFINGWFLAAQDGSTYEQGTASIIPNRAPDFILAPYAQTAVVDVVQYYTQIPVCGNIKCLFQNELGASIDSGSSSASYVKLWFITDQYPSI